MPPMLSSFHYARYRRLRHADADDYYFTPMPRLTFDDAALAVMLFAAAATSY